MLWTVGSHHLDLNYKEVLLCMYACIYTNAAGPVYIVGSCPVPFLSRWLRFRHAESEEGREREIREGRNKSSNQGRA